MGDYILDSCGRIGAWDFGQKQPPALSTIPCPISKANQGGLSFSPYSALYSSLVSPFSSFGTGWDVTK